MQSFLFDDLNQSVLTKVYFVALEPHEKDLSINLSLAIDNISVAQTALSCTLELRPQICVVAMTQIPTRLAKTQNIAKREEEARSETLRARC